MSHDLARQVVLLRWTLRQRDIPKQQNGRSADHPLRRAREQPGAGLDAEEFFDPESVRWYRRVFDERNPGRHQALSNVEFLNELGLVVEQGERLVPTRAAVLIFGRPRHVRRILPRPVVDCQFIDSTSDSWTTDRRWTTAS